MLPEKSSKILENINRNDKVYFFYKKFDTHGFACSYLFRKFFVKHEMLNNLELLEVRDTEEIDCDKDSYVFLCDIDVTPSIIFKLCLKAKKVFVIDSKDSTALNLLPRYTNNSLIAHTNLVFAYHKDTSPIFITWKLVFEETTPLAFVKDLDTSYQTEIGILEDNKSSIMRNIPQNHDIWDQFTSDDVYKIFPLNSFLDTASVVNSKNINIRNSRAINLLDHACLIINTNKEHMDEVGVMAAMACDLAITYEITDSGFFYKVYTKNPDTVDLFNIFSKYEYFGYRTRIWFKTKDFILQPKKSFLKRLKDFLLS